MNFFYFSQIKCNILLFKLNATFFRLGVAFTLNINFANFTLLYANIFIDFYPQKQYNELVGIIILVCAHSSAG